MHEHLHGYYDKLGLFYASGVWFRYTTKDHPQRWNFAQPDGLLIDPWKGKITIVEIKYNHTAEAYFQLVDRYLRLCNHFFGTERWVFSIVEVVHWYDCAVAFPTQPAIRDRIEDVRPDEFGVHVCRPS